MATISEIMAKGFALTKADLDELEDLLIAMPGGERYEREPDILEGLELIILDPDYIGDITIADLAAL